MGTADRKLRITGAVLILSAIAAFGILMSLFTPFAMDDWVFMAQYRDRAGSESLSIDGLLAFWHGIREYDNGRLANVFAPFSTLFNPWNEIFPYLNGLALAAVAIMASALASGRKWWHPLRLAILWALMLYFLPWRDYIFVRDYSLNYIWGALFTLGLIISTLECHRRGWTSLRLTGCLVLAVIAGGWHEGFAIPTLCGFLLLTLTGPRRYGAQWWVVGLAYAASTLFFLLCPGMLARTAEQAGNFHNMRGVVYILADFAPIILLALASLFICLFRKGRETLGYFYKSPVSLIGLGVIFTGLALSIFVKHSPRSAFWADLMAVIVLVKLLGTLRPALSTLGKAASLLFLLALAAIPMTSALVWQHRFYTEATQILKAMERSDSGTVFYDALPPESLPYHTLKIPEQTEWVRAFHYHGLREYTLKPYPAVVPSSLRGADLSAATPIESNVPARMTGDNIVIMDVVRDSSGVAESEETTVELTFDDGHRLEQSVTLIPYLSSDGRPYTYVYFHRLPPGRLQSIRRLHLPLP